MTTASTKERTRLETKTERRPAAGELVIDHAPRCWNCNVPLAWQAARPWSIFCKRCRQTTSSPPD